MEQARIDSVGLRRSTFSLFCAALRSHIGSWRLPGLLRPVPQMRFRQPAPLMNFPSPSEQPPRSLWIAARPKGQPSTEPASSAATAAEATVTIQITLMRFSAPSAHQVERINQRRVPCLLRSAFAVSSTLAVCSPLDPARLFHRAALLGFQGTGRTWARCEVRARAEPLPITALAVE